MAGAPALAARGALRAGAGLVTVAVPATIQPLVAAWHRETIVEALPEDDGALGPDARAALDTLRARVETPAFGMGIGRSAATAMLVRGLAASATGAIVFDADALHALGPGPMRFADEATVVLTPHEGEAAHLLARPVAEVHAHRERAAADLAKATGAIVVLKGRHTLVCAAARDGTRTGRAVAGHPVLATGGTGDVLAGAIAAFLAEAIRRGSDPFDAVRAAVHVHAEAGVECGLGGIDRGVLASEVADAMPRALAAWRGRDYAR